MNGFADIGSQKGLVRRIQRYVYLEHPTRLVRLSKAQGLIAG
jgi:hypothetical protein